MPWKWNQKVKIGLKIEFLGNISRTLHKIFLTLCMMFLPKILVWWVEGSKGQIWPENWVFEKYVKKLH